MLKPNKKFLPKQSHSNFMRNMNFFQQPQALNQLNLVFVSPPFVRLHSVDDGKATISYNPDNKFPSEWFFSQNNSFNRSKIYINSLHTSMEINPHYKYKVDTEAAVFSGNLFRLILGGSHPSYYVCEIQDYVKKIPCRLSSPYARASNAVENFCEWNKCVKVESADQISIFNKSYSFDKELPIKGLTNLFIAGYFLDEQDWSPGNFGLLTDSLEAIRIDPGLSFGDNFFNEEYEDIYDKLNHVLINYIFKIEDMNYLPEFKKTDTNNDRSSSENESLDQPELIHANLHALLNSRIELFETLARIISIPLSLYKAQALRDFSKDNIDIANHLVGTMEERIECFSQAAFQFSGFKEYFNAYLAEYTIGYYEQLIELWHSNFFEKQADHLRLFADINKQAEIITKSEKKFNCRR